MRWRTTAGLAAPLLALSLSSCGLLPGSVAEGGDRADRPPAGQSAEPTGTEAESTESPDAGPIATKTINAGEATLRIDITALTRQGELSTLSWNITVEEFQGEYYWGPGTQLGGRWGTGDYTVSNVTLIDSVNSKRYRVAYTPGEDGDCVCSGTADVELEEGQAASLEATFAAPPPGVRKVNVQFGDLGELPDVPIS